MKCQVSIAVSFFNSERTLADLIRSVFAQTLTDWELLLIDDGSSDSSLEIARRVQDPRVRVLCDGRNKRLATRMNEAAVLAQGKYFARMDADDLMHPQRLEQQVRFLDDNPEADLVGSAVITIDHANNPLGIRSDKPPDTRPESVLRRGLYIHPSVMGPTAWFRKNPYHPDFDRAEDLELWCRVCPTAVLRRIEKPLLFYREGIPYSLKNYLGSAYTDRKVFRKYGPQIVGRWQTALLIGKSHLKCLVYRIATPLHLVGWLLNRRNRPLTPCAKEEARAVIDRILRTRVPGLAEIAEPAASSAAECHCVASTLP